MKKLLILILVLSMSVANANIVNPLPTLVNNLDGMLDSGAGRKNITEMKAIANDRNTDVDIAFENYLIAKKNISVARAQFNPITTGHLLGMAMGITYLWAPLAIDAILSIPTKIYNVSKNKHLTQAANYNLFEARQVLNNELAHLYYDILTHEVILKTIDQEIQVLTYQEALWTARKLPASRIDDLKKGILRLGMERVDIYSMYVSELAAIRTLISITDENKYELDQVSKELDRSVTANIDENKLQSIALKNSNKYKSSISLYNASQANVKQVKWSIISISGLSFSYRKKVKEAKNEENIARMRMQSTALEVKTNVLLQLSKVNSSLDVFANYNSLSKESMDMYADTLESVRMGQLSEDAAIEASFGAIRDFRNKVVAHYGAWSSMDDFMTSANANITAATERPAPEQTDAPGPEAEESSVFKVVGKSEGNGVRVYLKSPKIGEVYKVTYIFDDLKTLVSDNGRSNYSVTLNGDLPDSITGVAVIRLDDKSEYKVKFKL